MKNDTIASISTALGEGAISIVRLSGENAVKIVNKIFKYKNLENVQSHTINYGHIYDNEELIDEVMVSVMRAPRTFTKEDVVEINCHGGYASTNKVLEVALKYGARLAEPGEFTKRAFLNGRIDLAQAESIMDVIRAKNDTSLSLAMNNLDGRTSRLIESLRNDILQILATIEVSIDYPEYDDVEELTNEILKPRIYDLKEKINKILVQSRSGKIVREGINTAIVGRPNVGKSSLLNSLMQEEKAIVTDIAGTTRDVIEGYINIGGVTLKLIDTAGIRKTSDVVEEIGVNKSKQLLEDAELTIVVLNNNEELNEDDIEILKKTENNTNIIVINKIDLDSKIDKDKLKDRNVVEMSLKYEKGLESLENMIIDIFKLGVINTKDMTYISNVRHINLLREVNNSLDDALQGLDNLMPLDMVEIDIKDAWSKLGEIIGLDVSEDLIDKLFSQFCLGK